MNDSEKSAFYLKGKVIVTEGTGILGYAFIKALSNAGAIVGIMGRNEAKKENKPRL